MAHSNNLVCQSFVASTDLSTRQFHIVDLDAGAFDVDLAIASAGYGVLQNKPQAGEHATVAVAGTTKCTAGAAISIGNLITSAASGYAAVVASGTAGTKKVIGRAVTAAASGSVFTMNIEKYTITQTAAT